MNNLHQVGSQRDGGAMALFLYRTQRMQYAQSRTIELAGLFEQEVKRNG